MYSMNIAENTITRIRLINGVGLSNLIVEFALGCKKENVFGIKKMNKGFFDEESR